MGSRAKSLYIYISPRKRVAKLNPQALGSLFVASYDSQGYDEAVRARLQAREQFLEPESESESELLCD
jgi:hypothetical protein